MLSTLNIECSETIPEIFIDIYQNNKLVTSNSFYKGVKQYTIEYNDTDAHTKQCIQVVMRGKTEEHVTDLYVNGNPCYYHVGSNNNQNGPTLTDEFYGFIGLNGEVQIEFTTPMWHWFNSKCS